MSMKYTYKDFATGKQRWTRGEFRGWSETTGPLGARYAIFQNPRGTVCVPAYCLTSETMTRLREIEIG